MIHQLDRRVNDFPSLPNTCTRKKRFDDEGSAWTSLLRFRDRGGDADRTYQIYKCPHCDGWHMGHRPGTKDENGEIRGARYRGVKIPTNSK